MSREYTALVKKEEGWWIGWIVEVPGVNGQEKTRKRLLESLRIVLIEALEFQKQDVVKAMGSEFREEKIAI